MSYFELFDEGRQLLFPLQDGENDARLLLLWAFQIDMNHLLMHYTDDDAQKNPDAAALYRQALELRRAHIPLQYITQRQNFCGLNFYIDKNVLIPRQDTECLVEKIIEKESDKAIRLLDLCTGSGCIAVALKVLGGYSSVIASDISREALKIADANALLNGADILFYESDMFSRLTAFRRRAGDDASGFDVVVSNPPYIRKEVFDVLMPEVREFEPSLALLAGENGLEYYRIIARDCGEYLKPGGRLYLEIGYDQAEQVTELLRESGFDSISTDKDLAGLDRIISAVYMG